MDRRASSAAEIPEASAVTHAPALEHTPPVCVAHDACDALRNVSPTDLGCARTFDNDLALHDACMAIAGVCHRLRHRHSTFEHDCQSLRVAYARHVHQRTQPDWAAWSQAEAKRAHVHRSGLEALKCREELLSCLAFRRVHCACFGQQCERALGRGTDVQSRTEKRRAAVGTTRVRVGVVL